MIKFTQFRVARPSHSLSEIKKFYVEGLGLPMVGEFNGHEGINGLMLGLPDTQYHLEFTEHGEGHSYPPPSEDNLLVFYYKDHDERDKVASRLNALGFKTVAPANPYWLTHGITIEDPDKWRVVLMGVPGFSLS
ncbi:MAG TPA: VOC family protein [Bacteroidia bacterium]